MSAHQSALQFFAETRTVLPGQLILSDSTLTPSLLVVKQHNLSSNITYVVSPGNHPVSIRRIYGWTSPH